MPVTFFLDACYSTSPVLLSLNDQIIQKCGNRGYFLRQKYLSRSPNLCPQTLWKIATRKLDQLDSVNALAELRIPPGNRLEALSGDRKGQYSIRINLQLRWDLYQTQQAEAQELETIEPYPLANKG